MHLIKKNINILLPLLVISAISRKFVPEFQFLYYLTPVLLILFFAAGYDKIFENKAQKTLTIMLLAFGFWAMVTAIWSDYPQYSLGRAGYFVLLVLGSACGIALWTETKEFKKNPFGFLLPANIFILVLNIISLIIEWPKDAWTGGNQHGFMGVFNVQLAFGRAMLVVFPAPFYEIVKSFLQKKNKDIPKPHKRLNYVVLFSLILVLDILFMLLSYSRAALLALAILILLSLTVLLTLKQKLYLYGSIIIITFLAFNIGFIAEKLEKFALKGTGHITANREILWGPSVEAIKVGGLSGIGYGTSVKGIETQYKIVDSDGILRREKGNSFMALVEEVGVIGLLLFILPLFYVFRNIFTSGISKNVALVLNGSLLIGLVLHAQFEDWMVGVSGFSILIFLMFLFLANHLSANNKQLLAAN